MSDTISTQKIIDFIRSHYKLNNYIYPSALSRILGLSVLSINAHLSQSKFSSNFQQCLKGRCKNCGEQFDFISDIGDIAFCDHCDTDTVISTKNTQIFYKYVCLLDSEE